MDLLTIVFISVIIGVILVCMGMSLISQSLEPTGYTNQYGHHTSMEYYNNPLWRYQSKYFHYRPEGTIILSRAKWKQIEKNVGLKLLESLDAGKKIGRAEMVEEIQDSIDERRAEITITNPYMLIGVTAKATPDEIELAYQELMQRYHNDHFEGLDDAFMELARIKRDQITKAYKKLTYGLGDARAR